MKHQYNEGVAPDDWKCSLSGFQMMGFVSAVFAKYAPVAIGLTAGSMAKFGRMMATGQSFTKKQVVGHAMMMTMIGLAAIYLTDAFEIRDPHAIAFASAVMAIAASEVIQWLATRAWLRFVNEGQHRAIDAELLLRGEIRQTEQIIVSADAVRKGKGE